MKEIGLTNGMVALVDDDDFDALVGFTWNMTRGYKTVYAYRRVITSPGKHKAILMHRSILGIDDKDIRVDHRNWNGLDNQRHNLRVCTVQQNAWNSDRKPSKHGFRGVSRQGSRFAASLTVMGKRVHLGYFATAEEAAAAYDLRVIELRGEFAVTNAMQAS